MELRTYTKFYTFILNHQNTENETLNVCNDYEMLRGESLYCDALIVMVRI